MCNTTTVPKKGTKRYFEYIDTQIEAIVRQHLSGVQINVLDIGKVFKAGRAAFESGSDVTRAVVDTYTALRQN